MAYATYEYYTDEYCGDDIDEASFAKWQARASDELDRLCFGRITDTALELYSTQIQNAACALADVLYKLNKAAETAGTAEGGNVKSISSGVQSISFGNTETEYTLAMSDAGKRQALLEETAGRYLYRTGLMYAGL